MIVSYIIPVFNAKNTLEKCVYSILAQDTTDFEIILVDDGSNDGSALLCDKLSSNNSKIKTFHVKNGGAARARNIGLQQSQGEFIRFVDADDQIALGSTKLMLDVMKKTGCNLVIGGIKKLHSKDELLPNEGVFSAKDEIVLSELLLTNSAINSLCNKLYCREKIQRYIPEDIRIGEDLYFNITYINNIQNFACINKIVYIYFDEPLSVTKTFRDDYIDDLIKVDQLRQRIISDINCIQELKLIFLSDVHDLLCILYKNQKMSASEKKQAANKILKNNYVRLQLKSINSSKITTKKYKILSWCIKHNLNWIIRALYKINGSR